MTRVSFRRVAVSTGRPVDRSPCRHGSPARTRRRREIPSSGGPGSRHTAGMSDVDRLMAEGAPLVDLDRRIERDGVFVCHSQRHPLEARRPR